MQDVLHQFYKTLYRRTAVLVRDEMPLLDWANKFLPHYFQLSFSEMHRCIAEQLDDAVNHRNKKINVLAPRGAAKSTLAALAYPLRELLEEREPYIWLISDTMTQAHTHLENIKTELLDNPLIAEHYPHSSGKGSVWRNGSITLKNGCTIESFGTGQRLRGRRKKEHRPSLIICDDLQNDQHIVSSAARERSRRWFNGTLLKAGADKTNIINLATALHREAIAMELTRTAGWYSKLFKAVQKLPVNTVLWEQWESIYQNVENPNSEKDAAVFYEEHFDAMNEGAAVLWKENEDLYTLMKIRAESGRTAFDREKQNSPLDPEKCEFPDSYFDNSLLYDERPDNIVLTAMSLDPSKGNKNKAGDYSAFTMVSLTEDGQFFVDSDIARRSVPELIETGVELYRRFKPDIFGVESNQFQELLKDEFERAFRDNGLAAAAVYPIHNAVNKTVRIRRLAPLLASKRIRFKNNSPSVKILLDQLKVFPIGDYDDGPDSLEMSVRMLKDITACAVGVGAE